MTYDRDYVLCECPLEPLVSLVESLEPNYTVAMAQAPRLVLTMLQAEDTVEQQPFYLGEALTTDCEVVVEGVAGVGIVLEDQPERAYCLAFLDALAQLGDHYWPRVEHFLAEQGAALWQREQAENRAILSSLVDFKLMEEA